MSRFFLHIHNSHGHAEDDEGIDATSLAMARERAVTGIRDLLSSEARNGAVNFDGRIDILDVSGQVLLSVPFNQAVSVSGL